MMETVYLFTNRHEAGIKLAARLRHEPSIQGAAPDEMLLLSIPSGGVVVGATVAQALKCAHDVIAVKKISCPWQEDRIIGAVAEYEMVTLSKEMTQECWHQGQKTGEAIKETRSVVEHYIDSFRAGRPLDLGSKVVILVDDGILTGETVKAAIKWMMTRGRSERPKKIVVAVPICAPAVMPQIKALADELICLSIPTEFWTVGQYYWDFSGVTDEEIIKHLAPGANPGLPLSHSMVGVAA